MDGQMPLGDDLKDLVFTALNNAVENGFGDEALNDTPENVAINLLDYDADISIACDVQDDRLSVMDLIPHIEAWREQRASASAT
jgi:hypothetical protein